MNDQFMSDLSQEVGTITQIQTLNLKFAEYVVSTIDGVDYIVGKKKDKTGLFLNFGNYKVLFSLFSIIKNPLPKYFNEKYLVDVIPIDLILRWCHDYGLPYENKVIWDKHKCVGFDIGRFRYCVVTLYSRFILWKALMEEDEAGINCNMLLVGLNPGDFISKIEKIKKIKENLAIYINAQGGSSNLESVYDVDNDRFIFKLRTRSIFDVCYYQFATLVTNDNIDFEGNFKTCKACGAFFWGHGNKCYCVNCDRRTVWSRNHKQSKKEGRQ